jgi:hypothetical protein
VPRNAAVSVGMVRIADLWDFCGARRRSSAAHVAGHLETWAPASGSRFAAEPRGWLASSAGGARNGFPNVRPGRRSNR